MHLIPFAPGHAAAVASWAASAPEARLWCGKDAFPVPAAQVLAWQQDPDASGYLLVGGGEPGRDGAEDGQPFGYGELWTEEGESEVELAHIIIAPASRGRGAGRELARLLAAAARGEGAEAAVLRVHPDNAAALRCYRAAGFATVDAATGTAWNKGQPVAYVWLRRT